MSTYTLTAITVDPLPDHGPGAYSCDIFGARKTITTAEVSNVEGLRHAVSHAALMHYLADPDGTPAVTVSTYCNGRHVAHGKTVGTRYYGPADLADRADKHTRLMASLAADLPPTLDLDTTPSTNQETR